MKQLPEENGRLKQLVADLSLDKTMLQDVLRKSGNAVAATTAGRLPVRLVPCQRTECLPSIANRPWHPLL
jgi:putative transposase